MRNAVLAWAVLAATVLWPVAAAAQNDVFSCTPTEEFCFVSIRWDKRVVPFVVQAPPEWGDPTVLIEATQAAADAWNSIPCSDMTLEFKGFVEVPTQAQTPSGNARCVDAPDNEFNQVIMVTQGWPARCGSRLPGQAGLTRMKYSTTDGTIRRGVMELNDDTFDFVDGRLKCLSNGETDLAAVITHEFGHMLGLAHPCEESFGFGIPAPPQNVGDGGGEKVVCAMTACDDLAVSRPEVAGLSDRPTMWPTAFDTCGEETATPDGPRFAVHQRTLESSDATGLCTIYPRGEGARNCLPLPNDTSVASSAFGCAASDASGLGSGLILFGLWALYRQRRHG